MQVFSVKFELYIEAYFANQHLSPQILLSHRTPHDMESLLCLKPTDGSECLLKTALVIKRPELSFHAYMVKVTPKGRGASSDFT